MGMSMRMSMCMRMSVRLSMDRLMKGSISGRECRRMRMMMLMGMRIR